MAHLNWTTKDLKACKSAHPLRQTALNLTLSTDERDELARNLRALAGAPEESINEELRVDLTVSGVKPEKWTLYWKIKIGLSKLSLAHPQEHEWVASLALARGHAVQIADAMWSGAQVAVGDGASLASFSNFELIIS